MQILEFLRSVRKGCTIKDVICACAVFMHAAGAQWLLVKLHAPSFPLLLDKY